MSILKAFVLVALAAGVLLTAAQAAGVGPPQPKELPTPEPDKAAERKAATERAQAEDVKKWLAGHAVALKGVEAGQGFKDMEPLKKVVGPARIVSLGEATHGTREFFQLKHRMLEFLVTEMSFTVFAIEASMPEGFDVNEYVLTGKGDPAKALAGLYFWTWDTEEVLDLIRWMRAYNADPRHEKKVKFYGYDMQSSPRAARVALTYLDRVDPAAAAKHRPALAALANAFLQPDVDALPTEKKKELAAAAGACLKQLDDCKADYVKVTSAAEWAVARQHARVLVQFCEMNVFGLEKFAESFKARDQAMAENVGWILDHEGPGAKVVLWAHNGHVQTSKYGDMETMGMSLRKTYGREMVVFGFAFNRGGFQAIDSIDGSGKGLRSFDVEAAPAGSLDALLASAGLAVAAVDLRALPKDGPVAAWFAEPRVTRNVGAVYVEAFATQFLNAQKVQDCYDAILFVEKTTPARPNKPRAQEDMSKPPAAVANPGFEDGEAGKLPPKWYGPVGLAANSYEAVTTTDDPHSGKRCVVIRRTAGPHYGETYGRVTQVIDATAFRGQQVRLRAAVRTDVTGPGNQAHLWLEVHAKEASQPATLDGPAARPIITPTWKVIEIVREIPKDAETISFGLALVGEGRAWLDSVSVEAVSK